MNEEKYDQVRDHKEWLYIHKVVESKISKDKEFLDEMENLINNCDIDIREFKNYPGLYKSAIIEYLWKESPKLNKMSEEILNDERKSFIYNDIKSVKYATIATLDKFFNIRTF